MRAGAQQESEIARLIAKSGAKQNIVKPASGILKHPYMVPAGPYTQLFDWDTYFMGVALSYDAVGEPLENSVKDFLDFTDENWNSVGYTPREIATDAPDALPQMCKPFLAQMALRASLTLKDYEWLREPSGDTHRTYYQKLGDTLAYWENTRRANDGLFRWFNGVESGVDNNPAVSDEPADVSEGVDLQCYIYREYRAMAVLAGKLGNASDEKAYDARGRRARKVDSRKNVVAGGWNVSEHRLAHRPHDSHQDVDEFRAAVGGHRDEESGGADNSRALAEPQGNFGRRTAFELWLRRSHSTILGRATGAGLCGLCRIIW